MSCHGHRDDVCFARQRSMGHRAGRKITTVCVHVTGLMLALVAASKTYGLAAFLTYISVHRNAHAIIVGFLFNSHRVGD